MVVMKEGVKESSLKRRRQHDLPTPESPINSSLICNDHVSAGASYETQRSPVGPYQEVIITRPSHLEYNRVLSRERGDVGSGAQS